MLFMCISHMYFFLIFLLFFIIIVYTMYLNMGSSVYLAMYFWKPAIKIYYYYYYYYSGIWLFEIKFTTTTRSRDKNILGGEVL